MRNEDYNRIFKLVNKWEKRSRLLWLFNFKTAIAIIVISIIALMKYLEKT